MNALVDLDKSLSGHQVTRLGNSLQSATQTWRDEAYFDWIVSTLLHDIGDIFASCNHDKYAATILRPVVRDQCTWSLKITVIFKWTIILYTLAPIRTNEKYTKVTFIKTTVLHSANIGIRRAMIPITIANR